MSESLATTLPILHNVVFSLFTFPGHALDPLHSRTGSEADLGLRVTLGHLTQTIYFLLTIVISHFVTFFKKKFFTPAHIYNRADAQIASQATGAMSWAFITALKKNPQQSYVQLLNSIRDELATKYTQKPQLSCSHPLSTWRYVFR
jgi:Caspase domain